MVWSNKVVWSEGMFLRAQHFQQQDRHTDALVRAVLRGLGRHGWGFTRLKLNTSLLTTGKLAIAEAEGILPDGTPFLIPEDVDHPAPLQFDPESREGVAYLALPEVQPGAVAFDPEASPDRGARFRGRVVEVRDSVSGGSELAPVEVARPTCRLLKMQDDLGGFVAIGIARAKGVQPDGALTLDPDYLPPCLTIAGHPTYANWLNEIEGKLESVAASRIGYVMNPAARGAAEVQDILVLELVNGAQPVVAHFKEQLTLHPESLYWFLLGLAGEMATYGASERRPPAFPPYRHDDPASSFQPLIDTLRRLLVELARPERKAVPIPVHRNRSGIWAARVDNPKLFAQATFVLAVKLALPSETTRQLLSRQGTIGPVEEFQDLWLSRLTGIAATPLAVAPRQIPYHAGMVYFELDRTSPYWSKLTNSSGIAIGVSGEVPEEPKPELECWAIRD
ncbi:MAG TPA: type VI secretion system baseplate subunit TssK [Geminicoccaceae bacterium]|jgi:type VI secretion system protein ImpJ|nr:type VI secretion system baseplate subunit TssK [Geminicoccaceae bacterium]